MKNNTGRNLCTSDQATLSCRFLTGPDRLLFSRGVVEALGRAPYIGLYVDTADRYFAVQAFSKKERCCFPFFNTQYNAAGGVVLPYETVVRWKYLDKQVEGHRHTLISTSDARRIPESELANSHPGNESQLTTPTPCGVGVLDTDCKQCLTLRVKGKWSLKFLAK